VKFYFKYLLKLRETEKIGLKPVDIGNFLHDFFEKTFKELEGKEILIGNIYSEEDFLNRLENLWLSYRFERKMDALSHYFSKKIARETIKKYFNYLIELEKKGNIKGTQVLGVERDLKLLIPWNLAKSFEGVKNNIQILLSGRTDFIIKRREGITKYLILDFKSNPDIIPYSRKAKEIFSFVLPEKFDQTAIYEIANLFGSTLSNFQLLFYYFLFYQQREKFVSEKEDFVIINAGFITPSDFKRPEKFIFNISKKGEWAKIYNYFESGFKELIEWILNHIIISDKFYFPEDDKICKFCEYRAPCKNYRYLLG
jgi:CRISPR/Cas system-associated exonuclease Cas4 (RecB family)